MAKILVADDNSNVQKTVALALADLGVEVVAVNNGEAAVRKLADISPDLVLADIFMPVRNGYEVCEYREKRFSFCPCAGRAAGGRVRSSGRARSATRRGGRNPKKAICSARPADCDGENAAGSHAGRPAGDRGGFQARGFHAEARLAESQPRRNIPLPRKSSEELPVEEFQPPVDRLSFGEGERPHRVWSSFWRLPRRSPRRRGRERSSPLTTNKF